MFRYEPTVDLRGNPYWFLGTSNLCPFAKIFPNGALLRKAGVKRIVLAAGERDMMKWQMVGQARRLARQKFPVAFMSMGPVGHWFPRDMDQRLRRALDWVHGDDAAFPPTAPGELAWLPPPHEPARRDASH